MTSYTGPKVKERIAQNKRKPNSLDVDGWLIIGAALTVKDARRIEREYQARYNCLDGMNDPAVVAKVVAKTTGKKRSQEFIANCKTYTPWNKGKTLTPEQLAKHATHQPGWRTWNSNK